MIINYSLIFILFTFVQSLTLPTINVSQGKLIGTNYTAAGGKNIYAFYGIPYALPPILNYRFKGPHYLRSWAGTWNATFYRNSCIQYSHSSYSIVGEEDCLYLNVFTSRLPTGDNDSLMNVIVYIHGGAFMFGSSKDIYPDFIMRMEDVVFVTVNYRLGVFGFFSTGDNSVPGNNGLKDQVLALKWIKANIVSFGGNPESITLTGTSAGGASVHYHYISQLSKGLFHRGISFSGTVFAPWTMPKNVPTKSIKLAHLLNCNNDVSSEMVTCLQSIPAERILEVAAETFISWRYSPFTVFGPVIEPSGEDSFLSSDPFDAIISGQIADLPWLTTVSKHEGLYPVADFIGNEKLLRELNDDWVDILPDLLQYNDIECPRKKYRITSLIRKFYFNNKNVSKDTAKEIIQMAGDRLFYVPIRKAMKVHAYATSSPVYCYQFNYRGKYSLSNLFARNNENYGVSHADDLQYILKVYYGNPEDTKSDSEMMEKMTKLIVSFIHYSKPVMDNTVVWDPISMKNEGGDDELNCLKIYSPFEQEMFNFENPTVDTFWDSLLPDTYHAAIGSRLHDEF